MYDGRERGGGIVPKHKACGIAFEQQVETGKTMRKPVKKVWKRWRPMLFSKEKAKQSPCSVGK